MKPEVTAETNLNVAKKPRQARVPQDAGVILQGALKLPLKDRVDLKNALSSSIESELKAMEIEFFEAKKLITGQ